MGFWMPLGPKCAWKVRWRCLMQAVQQGSVHFQQLLPSEFRVTGVQQVTMSNCYSTANVMTPGAVNHSLNWAQTCWTTLLGPLPDTEKPEKMFFFPLQTGVLISGGPPHTVLIFINHQSFSSLQMFHSWLSDSLFLLKLYFCFRPCSQFLLCVWFDGSFFLCSISQLRHQRWTCPCRLSPSRRVKLLCCVSRGMVYWSCAPSISRILKTTVGSHPLQPQRHTSS